MNLQVKKTNNSHPEYQRLVKLLDLEIQKRDGEDFGFYNQFNSSEDISEVLLIMHEDKALGCGAIKIYNKHTAEVKRMFTEREHRGKGIATLILEELVHWARELGYKSLILETGKKYTEAVSLYQKYGFERIENYEPYEGVEESLCFKYYL